jgi:hypothetical protein
MAEQKNNKRVIYGAVFLGVLVVLNLLVHGSRAGKKKPVAPKKIQKSTTPVAQIPQPVTPLPVDEADVEIVIDSQIKDLNKKLQSLEKDMKNLPPLLKAPDFSLTLNKIDRNLFQWAIKAKPQVASETVKPKKKLPVTKVLKPEVIGAFNVGGKKKLLVKEGSKVYLVIQGDVDEKNDFNLLSHNEKSFIISDKMGKTHILNPASPDDTKLQEIIAKLKKAKQQTSFDVRSSSAKQNSEESIKD